MIKIISHVDNRLLVELQADDGTPFGAVEIVAKSDEPREGYDTIVINTTVDHDAVTVRSAVGPS